MPHTVIEVLNERAAELAELFLEARELRQTGSKTRAESIEREAVAYRNHTLELIENWSQLGMIKADLPRKYEIIFGFRLPA